MPEPLPPPRIDPLTESTVSGHRAASGEIVRRTLAALPDEEKRLLCALAAVGGGPVGASHLPILADVPNPAAALESLRDQKLVEIHSHRYGLAGELAGLLDSTWDLAVWRDRALAHFLPWAEARRADPAALAEEGIALRRLFDWAVQAGRHGEALRLGRTLEAAAAVSGRWAPPAPVSWGEIHPRSTPLRPLPWLAAAVLAFLVLAAAGVRLLSSRIGAEQAAPAPTEVEQLSTDRASPPVTTDLRIEETEPTLPLTTDQPLEEGIGILNVSRDRVEFSTLALGASADPAVETFAVTNAGDADLRVAGISFTDNPGRAFAWRSSCQQRPVPPGGECAVHVLFQPPAAGSYGATLALDTDRRERLTVEISGAAREEEQSEPGMQADAVQAGDEQGWCCAAEGRVLETSEADCTQRGGAFYRRQRPAQIACALTNTGCCLGGSFELNVPADQCALRGGVAMTPGEALVRCRPPATPPPGPG